MCTRAPISSRDKHGVIQRGDVSGSKADYFLIFERVLVCSVANEVAARGVLVCSVATRLRARMQRGKRGCGLRLPYAS